MHAEPARAVQRRLINEVQAVAVKLGVVQASQLSNLQSGLQSESEMGLLPQGSQAASQGFRATAKCSESNCRVCDDVDCTDAAMTHGKCEWNDAGNRCRANPAVASHVNRGDLAAGVGLCPCAITNPNPSSNPNPAPSNPAPSSLMASVLCRCAVRFADGGLRGSGHTRG